MSVRSLFDLGADVDEVKGVGGVIDDAKGRLHMSVELLVAARNDSLVAIMTVQP